MIVEESRHKTSLFNVFLEAGKSLGYKVLQDQVSLSTFLNALNAIRGLFCIYFQS